MFQVYAEVRYERREQIGRGEGMHSLVFRAFDPYLQREIAVKEIVKARFGNDFNEYCREARTMEELADPNIVPVKYVCETSDHLGLALPYFPKGSLHARITNGPLATRQLLKMSHDVASAMSRIHRARFLHLDVKPSNVLFDRNEVALVADFGQARQVTAGGTVKFPEVYKWAMPPEVWTYHTAVVESDIYQLGVLLYRAANGDPVYAAQKAAIDSNTELQRLMLRGQFPDRKFFLPHVPPRLRTIIRKAMRVDPAERYHSVSDLAADLARVRLELDWAVQPLGNGAYNWRAVRANNCDLEVELNQDSSSKWTTSVWTRGSKPRAKGLSDFWRRDLTYAEACTHLTEVFADLGR